MAKPLNSAFFSQSTFKVAKSILGNFLCRKIGKKTVKLRIMEVEAYDGFSDKASHASNGVTKRNKLMFGPAGVCYIYLVYGMHHMLNIVTREEGYPAAVLIRTAGEYDGPGKLSNALGITRRLNGRKATVENKLWIEPCRKKQHERIVAISRIGVEYAGHVWSKKKYRFFIDKGNPKSLSLPDKKERKKRPHKLKIAKKPRL
jgi:DNA-3-methyladenine glycosylase